MAEWLNYSTFSLNDIQTTQALFPPRHVFSFSYIVKDFQNKLHLGNTGFESFIYLSKKS